MSQLVPTLHVATWVNKCLRVVRTWAGQSWCNWSIISHWVTTDQIFLALFSIFMKINDANYQGKYKDGYFPHVIGFPHILEVLFPSAIFFFSFGKLEWLPEALNSVSVQSFGCVCVCVCVCVYIYFFKGRK